MICRSKFITSNLLLTICNQQYVARNSSTTIWILPYVKKVLNGSAYLIGCLQQSIRCAKERSIIVQINKKPIQFPFFFPYVAWLIISDRVCWGRGVWCLKTRKSPRNQAKNHWRHPPALNILRRIFKVPGICQQKFTKNSSQNILWQEFVTYNFVSKVTNNLLPGNRHQQLCFQ